MLIVANFYGIHGAMIFFAYVLSGMHLSFSNKVSADLTSAPCCVQTQPHE